MDESKTIYVTYIASQSERVWEALCDGAFTSRYFFGLRAESDWRVGSGVKYFMPDGTLHVFGEVLASDPPRRVSFTWNVASLAEFKDLPRTTVTFELVDLGKVVRLTMTESHAGLLDERMLEGGRRGWPVILSSLKTLLETGRALPPFDMSYQRQAAEEMMKVIAQCRRG